MRDFLIAVCVVASGYVVGKLREGLQALANNYSAATIGTNLDIRATRKGIWHNSHEITWADADRLLAALRLCSDVASSETTGAKRREAK